MPQQDIVARLQLRAEQFSSETGRAFADMKTRAATAAQDVRSQFTSSFAEVQRLAQTALQVPRTASGGLDLSGQIADLRQAAAAADENAGALRALSLAANEAANAERVDGQALRLRADAAAVGSLASEKAAAGYRDEILALEAMQAELNRAGGGLTRINSAHQVATVSAGAQRAAYQQLGFQLSDFTTQVAGGTSVFVAFSQQAGQAAGAIGLLAGESKGFIGFLGGPWTQVILAGVSIVGLLVTSHRAAADAEGAHASAADDLKGALDRLTGSIGENNHATRQGMQDDLNAAVAKRDLARASLEAAKAQLKSDLAYLSNPSGGSTSPGSSAVTGVAIDASITESKIKDLDAALANLGKGVRSGEIKIAMRDAEGATDKAAAATHRYEDALNALQRRYTAAGSKLTRGQFEDQAQALMATRDAALEAARAHDKHARSADGSAKATREAAAAAREAAVAERALAAELSDVQSKFDPAAKAARDYAAELTKIDDLANKGAISPGQALDYKLQASAAEIKKQAELSAKALEDLTGTTGAKMLDGIMAGIEAAKPDLTDMLQQAGTSGGQAFAEAASQISSALGFGLGGKTGGLLSSAFSLIGGPDKRLTDAINVFSDKVGDFATTKLKLDDRSVASLTKGISGALNGAVSFGNLGTLIGGKTGGQIGQLLGAIGGSASATSGIGQLFSSIQNAMPELALASAANVAIGKVFGFKGGPLGVFTGLVNKIFGGATPKGFATLSASGGSYSDVTTSGNKGSLKKVATGLAGNVHSSLDSIIDQLGGELGSFTEKIGQKGKKFLVTDPVGGKQKYKSADEAVAAAISNAIKQGAIGGISAAARKIFDLESDLDTAISKATLIESVPRDLKAMLDPVGAAVDDLNRKFRETVDALKEGGATSEQMAQAQQLYSLQLDQVKTSTDAADAALKDFRNSLLSGSNSPLSLRDQETQARSVLQPFLDSIAGGKTIDQGKYQDAAQGFLDIERQLYGSTDKYFAAFDQIQAATTKAIETIDNAVPITSAVPDPFAQATATATQSTATSTQATAEMTAQVLQQLAQNNQYMATLVANLSKAANTTFASGLAIRGFGSAA